MTGISQLRRMGRTSDEMCRIATILLMGPTGSGKTPLGEFLEQNGRGGRRCVHLDFGARLRSVAAGDVRSRRLSDKDIDLVRRCLATQALLENEDFHVAADIVADFVEERRVGPSDVIVLNGLPRHASQAEGIDRLVDVRLVVYLECSAEVVKDRIGLNSGGDRDGRADDDPEAMVRKLNIFRERTLPILDHYGRKGIRIERMCVAVDTLPAAIAIEMDGNLTADDTI